MRVSEIKAELDVRGIGYAGIFEKVRRSSCVCACGNDGLSVSHRLPKRQFVPRVIPLCAASRHDTSTRLQQQ